ncbi:MAG: UDP-N-acetylmuramate dehydrogenase [Acidimicrobiales bacterium]|nr:UDP-N-acetylmuramate dehydrogenase [Acidimicrobiales bacterium]
MTRGPGSEPVARALDLLGELGERVRPGGALGPLTTYRVGGPAALLVTVTHRSELQVVARAVEASGLPVLIVGRGSNLLVSDAGFDGIALQLDAAGFGAVEISGTTVGAGASVALPALARQTVDAGLTGFEWAVGVPGSIGGAVRMNAGGHGSDLAASLRSARVTDLARGTEQTLSLRDLAYGYRRSSVTAAQVVTDAVLDLAPGDPASGRETIREIVRWRRQHQPGGQNAGSVFANPPGDSAGRLIDAAGLKGLRWGSAVVSPKHANFIQADPSGSADDVFMLMGQVRQKVYESLGVDLATEVRLVGFPPGPQEPVPKSQAQPKPQVQLDPFAGTGSEEDAND